jgi:PleD family two-component response regulator
MAVITGHRAAGTFDDTLRSQLSRADHAMYRVSQTGRNRNRVEMPYSTYA